MISNLNVLQVAGEVLNKIKKRENYYEGIGATLQPIMLVVGKDKTTITECYVFAAGALWKLGSLMQALDVCFKSFFALLASYPPEEYHLGCLCNDCCTDFR